MRYVYQNSCRRASKGAYRSGLEKKIADKLTTLNVDFTYESETIKYNQPIRATCSGCGSNDIYKSRTYTPDFIVKKKDGNKCYLEAKGRFTSADRTKMQAIIQSNPELDIRMVFMRDQFLTKDKKATYSSWCIRKQIPFCTVDLPKQWIKQWKQLS